MAIIRNPVTVVQEGGSAGERDYSTEANAYGETAIIEVPTEYTGSYTITENGTVPCSGKKMTADLSVNVESSCSDNSEGIVVVYANGGYLINEGSLYGVEISNVTKVDQKTASGVTVTVYKVPAGGVASFSDNNKIFGSTNYIDEQGVYQTQNYDAEHVSISMKSGFFYINGVD